MRVELLSGHLPDPEGTAAGRVLAATAEGLLGEGVELLVTSWSPTPPAGDPPPWLRWAPLPPEPAWRRRGRALVRPRSDVRLLGWSPTGTAVADDPLSAAALPPGGVATVHYATALDVTALGLRRPRPKDVQDLRAERRVRRGRVLAYSERVARWSGGLAVPAALRVPERPLPLVEAPVAALVADWRWAPNRVALRHLLEAWSEVDVPGARLLLAGRGGSPVGGPGVEWLGEVADVREVLEQAALLAFPCPGTSGPKVKVLEAAAAGLPVLTTASGAEGVATDALHVRGLGGFAPALRELLADPGRRAAGAQRAREQVAAVHGPGPAARARLEATQRLQRDEQHEEQGRQAR
ncbi:MAG: glycosyltransferase [Mycobacteriales bacterium]